MTATATGYDCQLSRDTLFSGLNGEESGGLATTPRAVMSPSAYWRDVHSGKAKALDFTLYVPPGLHANLPNLVASSDPAKILTASFASGKELWG